ncbi:uncharacterized protein C1orf112 homolog isoform X3 [Peromyscus californicus insignis]|uniref:uncharacterized protein C1orf112 homolog isoform X3 n=1 Tax=Peromyscus californicus insignis TaxID=564181 RepID=UPI0022A751DA|nr:uncharacterized protein C1orf112 homolog isoform X3 [Peromyscus californicus insignis]
MVWCGRSALKACWDGVTSVLTCGGSWTRSSVADAGRMSQDADVEANRVVLETFSSWSREDCRRELPSALPRLLSMYQHSESWIEHIRILKIITDMFLPHVNHLTLEQSVFSQILPKTIKLFDGMIYELTTQATELSSQNLEIQITLRNILQTMAQILGGLTGFVHHVCTTQESVILEYIHSLPSSILHIIKKTFVHCKNSESLYSGRLHLLSDLLQGLFREAYSLQKKLMELLDMVCMGPSVDENNILLMVEAQGLVRTISFYRLANYQPGVMAQACTALGKMKQEGLEVLGYSFLIGCLLCYLQYGPSISCQYMEVYN